MSYEYLTRWERKAARNPTPEYLGLHFGRCDDFLKGYQKLAQRAHALGIDGIRSLAPKAFDFICDPRTVRSAWDFLASKGGQAPGPNGLRYAQLTSSDAWDLCRCLARSIRHRTYRPGPERVHWIDKESGKGRRPLVLLNIEDRVVQRAICLILQPLLDPLFDRRSFGFRPKLGRLHAVALAECLTLRERRHVWLTADIKDAFLHVPVARLLQHVQKLLPNDRLIELLSLVLPARELPGLRQGGPLSPLMLNVYLNHCLDRPWRECSPGSPLIRFADDILVLCRTTRQAHTAHADLARLLLPTGMGLKAAAKNSTYDLDHGASANWLGFVFHLAGPELAIDIDERSWTRLGRCFVLAHTKSDAPLRAINTVKQWLGQRGPCFTSVDRGEVCRRIIALARKQSFEEMLDVEALLQNWQRAHARWMRLRRRQDESTAAATGNGK